MERDPDTRGVVMTAELHRERAVHRGRELPSEEEESGRVIAWPPSPPRLGSNEAARSVSPLAEPLDR